MRKIVLAILMVGTLFSEEIIIDKNELSSDFVRDDSKEIVVNNKNNLMWQDDDHSSRLDISFAAANAYCRDLIFSGYSDWHLPTLDELKTIIDEDNYPKAVDKTFINTFSEYYWSSTEYSEKYAWLVLFRYGSVDYYYKTDTNHLRCVRKSRE